jgi:hypothetical protein
MNFSLDLGTMSNHRLLESTGQSLELSECTECSSNPVTPNPYSSHLYGIKVIAYWVTTWIK